MQEFKTHRRILTLGWVFLLILALLVLSAMNTGTNLLYLISGGVLSFVLLSFLLSRWNLAGLTVARDIPAAAYRGEPFAVHVRVENHKRAVPAVSLRLRIGQQPQTPYAHIARIPSATAAAISMQHVFHARGVQPLPPLSITTAFPFGLLSEIRDYARQDEVVVYPKIHPVHTSALEHLPGMRCMPRVASADGGEFFGLRKYQPGDDLRRVAWRISARRGEWIVRELGRENTRTVFFVLDTRQLPWMDQFDTLFEEAIDLVASLAVALLKRHYTVGVITATGMLEGGEGPAQEIKVLGFLARLQPVSESEHGALDDIHEAAESHDAVHLYVSADATQWGHAIGNNRIQVLTPSEYIHG